MLLNWERFVECTGFLESRLRCPYVVSKAHDESWWDCADRITRLRYEGHDPIIVFDYYQNHEGTLYYYHTYFVFVKSVFFLIASFFTNIFASCVVSVSFELRLPRVHPFSLDETFVFLCLWSAESHDVRRHEIVVKELLFIDKIWVTHRSFSELIYWIAISLLIKSRWTKCQCRFSQLLQKKAYMRFEDHRPDKHVILLRSTDIMQFACCWSIPERIRLR